MVYAGTVMRRLYLRCWPPSCRCMTYVTARERERETDREQVDGAVDRKTRGTVLVQTVGIDSAMMI